MDLNIYIYIYSFSWVVSVVFARPTGLANSANSKNTNNFAPLQIVQWTGRGRGMELMDCWQRGRKTIEPTAEPNEPIQRLLVLMGGGRVKFDEGIKLGK